MQPANRYVSATISHIPRDEVHEAAGNKESTRQPCTRQLIQIYNAVGDGSGVDCDEREKGCICTPLKGEA